MARLYDDVVTVQTVATSSILWSWCQPQAFMLSSFTFLITIIIIGVSFAEPLSAEGHYHSHSKPSIGQRNEESCHVGWSSRPNQDPVLQLRKSCSSENFSLLSTARLHLKSFSINKVKKMIWKNLILYLMNGKQDWVNFELYPSTIYSRKKLDTFTVEQNGTSDVNQAETF